jgi:thiamine transporter
MPTEGKALYTSARTCLFPRILFCKKTKKAGRTMKKDKTRTLVECALMIAMATVLSYIPLFSMPWGGSITLCSMAPLVIVSFRHGVKWGVGTGFVHGFIQMMLELQNVMYAQTFLAMAGVVLIDYLLAFAGLGLACVFAKGVANRTAGYAAGTAVACALRLFCSFLSGILIWSAYAPEGTPVWIYSLIYNASYMIPETILTIIAVAAVMRILDKRFSEAGGGAGAS